MSKKQKKSHHLITIRANLGNFLKSDIKTLKRSLDKKNYHIIIKNFEKNPKNLKIKIKKFANLLGKTLQQNKAGKKIVEVKPNVKLLNKFSGQKKKEKLRYHQTNQGGSIHSDGPQLKIPPKYLLMACTKPAKKGGYSIITYTNKVYDFIKRKKPNYLNILKKNFLIERRGFNFPNDNIFEKPIFEKKKNFFRFRYLREYIETAYKIKKIKLKSNQIKALNFLDSLIENKRFQKRYKLNKGDIVILNNNILAHGRTQFSLSPNVDQRTLIRIWIK